MPVYTSCQSDMGTSIFQAGKRLGVSRTRVNQFIDRGDLEVSRDEGQRVWVDDASLEALIERRLGERNDSSKTGVSQSDARAQTQWQREEKEREQKKREAIELQRKLWADEDNLRFRIALLDELRQVRKALTGISSSLTVLSAAVAMKLGLDVSKKD